MPLRFPHVALVALSPTFLAVGCAGDTGRVQVYVEAEDSIVHGVAAGAGAEAIQDGWNVTFTDWIMVLGGFRASSSADGQEITASDARILDLRALPAGGLVLADLEDVAVTRFDDVSFDSPRATDALASGDGLDDAARAQMIEGGFSVYVSGTISDDTRTIAFFWGVPDGVRYADCAELEGAPGFATVAGGTTQVKLTIHGDHAFFDSTNLGAENVTRRAGWIAHCDDNHGGADGMLTPEDLMACPAAEAFPAGTYGVLMDPFGGAISTAWDFVRAQMRTLGHLDGDGDCATRTPL